MRRELEIAARAWVRPLPLVGGAGLLVSAALAGYAGLSSYLATSRYIVAFMGAGLSLTALSSVERAAWPRPSRSLDVAHFGTSLGASLVGVIALQAAAGLAPDDGFGLVTLLGCAHLAALGLVARRVPGGAVVRAVSLFAAAIVVPALVPSLRPVLDASPSFHGGLFPGCIAAVAPIFSLIVIASALPSPVRAAAGNSTA